MSEHHRTASWQTTVRVNRPRIAKTLPAPCIDCGRAITAESKWQVGHIVPVAIAKAQGWSVQQINHPTNLGPTHAKAKGQRACNQIAGGKLGGKISSAKAATRREERRMPSW